ncbi:NADH-quinone oxidoreductase subunit C [Clostridium magnum]|uniref:Hydrogenase-4 component G n=1 Tax=Clostridium magnum DSM 2767 TaxID=1121326 RepID=A0A161WWP4_9CLOT|nr:NADH-quinone oxidoreductase subunit C [Clostridium magnum]KZL91378.1 hydrogenase-4 component G [Clostridium magnum DSM 2767]SHH40179.1 Ni,Fe-hydrogenase III large subunit [Clostridium magnum DSM 2767]
MRIHEVNEDILNLEFNVNTEIKNGNELYVYIKKEDIKDIVDIMFTKYRLYFAGEFCMQRDNFLISIILTNRKKGYFVILRYETEKEIISLQGFANQSHLFEREIKDLFGLQIVDGEDKRTIVKHELWEKDVYPLRKEFEYGRKIRDLNQTEDYAFREVVTEGGYQIPVGPVHAGIIEPGHFRFSVIGEPIENLQIRLMYKHRGIEKICENTDINKLNLIFERVAGESSVAYGEAYAQLIEKMIKYGVSKEIRALRVVLLELERIYNFLDDVAGICVDIGFSYPAKKFGYLSEIIHQLCERITGSRFLRNSIIPCGTNINFTKGNKIDILETVKTVEKRFNEIVDITLGSVSFLDRVEHTGIVENKIAKHLNMTGVVGRASEIHYDVRRSFPYEIYKEIKKSTNFKKLGGVFERYSLKLEEIRDAFKFIRESLDSINDDIKKSREKIRIEEGKEGFAVVETVKGELIVYGKVGENNEFDRVYLKTPSFTNWKGLTYAVLGEIVPDFPLCNKSFNMSYSENDR